MNSVPAIIKLIPAFSIPICCPCILSFHISQLVRFQPKNLYPDIVCNFCQLQDYSGQVKLRSEPEFHSGSLHQSLVFNSVSLGHERSNELPSSVPKSSPLISNSAPYGQPKLKAISVSTQGEKQTKGRIHDLFTQNLLKR